MFGHWNLLNGSAAGSYPAFNVYADEERVTVLSEVPGVAPEAIEIAVEDDILAVSFSIEEAQAQEGVRVLRRERPRGSFKRRIALPYGIEKNEVQATSEAGVLRIELPRAKEERPRRISVKVA